MVDWVRGKQTIRVSEDVRVDLQFGDKSCSIALLNLVKSKGNYYNVCGGVYLYASSAVKLLTYMNRRFKLDEGLTNMNLVSHKNDDEFFN